MRRAARSAASSVLAASAAPRTARRSARALRGIRKEARGTSPRRLALKKLRLDAGPAQVQCEGKVRIALFGAQVDVARRMAHAHEAREAAAFGFVGVDGEAVVA